MKKSEIWTIEKIGSKKQFKPRPWPRYRFLPIMTLTNNATKATTNIYFSNQRLGSICK